MAEEVGSAFVSLIPSARGFSRAARRELRTALAGVSGDVRLNPDVDEAQAAQAGRRASTLAQAAAGDVELDVTVDRRRLRQVLASLSGFGKVSIGATVGLAAIAAAGQGLAAALAGVTAALGGLVQVIGQLGVVLVQSIGALAIIPGALAVGGVAVAALAVGFSGLGEALGATGEDAATFEAAIQGLAGNAQEFARAVRDVRPAFAELRLDVQQALFAGLGDSLRELAQAQLPVLRRGLVGVAGVLNGAMADGMATLASRQSQLRLGEIFSSSRIALRGFTSAVEPLLTALLDVAAVGADIIADFAAPLGEGLAGFAEMVSAMSASGELRELILGGFEALRVLGAALVDIGGILGGFFGAAAEGGGLFAFLDRLNETINSLTGQRALTDFFTELGRIGDALMPVLLAFGQALGAVSAAIADIAVSTAPFLADFLILLGDALAALAPGFIALGPAVVALGQGLLPLANILADLVVGIAPGVETFLLALGDGLALLAPAAVLVGTALGEVLEAVAPLLPLLGAGLANALTILATILTGFVNGPGVAFVEVLSEIFTALIGSLTPVLTELAERLMPVFVEVGERLTGAFDDLAPVIATLAGVLGDRLVDVLPELVGAFEELALSFADIAGPLGQALVDVLLALVPEMPALVDAGLDLALAFTDLFVALVPLLPDLALLLGLVLQLVTPAAVASLTTLVAGLTAVLSGQASSLRNVVAGFQALVGWFRTARDQAGNVRDAISNLTRWFGRLPGRIRSAVGNLGRLLFGAGRQLIQGLINGINNMLGNLWNTVSGIANRVTQYWPFSPAERGPLRTHPPEDAGAGIIGGIASGLRASAPQLDAALAAVTADVAGVLGGPGSVEVAGSPADQRVVIDANGLPRALAAWLRGAVRTSGGGSVQRFAGQGAPA